MSRDSELYERKTIMSVSFKDGCLQFSDDMQRVHGNYIGRQDIKEVILPVDLKDLQYYRDIFFWEIQC